LFPNLSDDELATAIREASAPTEFELPGQNPTTGEGLVDMKIKGDQSKPIAYHQNMKFRGIQGAPHDTTWVRYHSANPNAPEGTYSETNPTVQVNTKEAQFGQLPDGSYKRTHDMTPAERAVATDVRQTELYRLPDGEWKPISAMSEAEKAAAHYPAGGGGGSDIVATPAPATAVEAPPAVEGGSGGRNVFRPDGAVDRAMRGASYGFQFFGNLGQGQDLGEAAAGAAAGGYASNALGSHLMSTSPRMGLADAGINLFNTGLQLVGAPEEVTTVTQTVADATPTSFGTSVVSNAGRGLYNLVTGDLEGLKQQGKDIIQGKSGAPMQGYAVAGEAAYALLSGDDEMLDRIREENASGKRGKLAQLGSRIGRGLREWTDSLSEYDEWDALMEGGPEAAERFRKMKATEEQRELAYLADRAKRQKEEREEEQKREAQFQLDMEMSKKLMWEGPQLPLQTQIPVRYDEEGNPVPVRMALEPMRKGKRR
jgi:hypothetical protein